VVISVPLTAEHPAVAIDLQGAFATTYERYYAARLEYREPPPSPRLQPADLAWVNSRLAAWRAPTTDR
jgi:hypothetical protein